MKRKYSPNQQKMTNDYKRRAYRNISIGLSKIYESDLIEIYERIPDKAGWLKSCLREYGEKHPR